MCICVLTAMAQPGFSGTARATQAPVFFEPNRGQFDASAQFVGRTADVSVGLFADGVGFETTGSLERIRARFLGMERDARWSGTSSSSGLSHYLTADSNVTGVPRFQGARLKGVYPGIDLEIHGIGTQMEYDFIVQPGADPSRIRYNVEAPSVSLSPQGDLISKAGSSEMRNRAPKLYQERNGVRTPVQGRFILRGHTVSFEVGRYNTREALVIDPIIFTKTISSSGFSWASAATTDAAGNLYIVGYADSAFSATGVQKVFGGGTQDAVVAKYSPTGDAVWSTFLGGSGADVGQSIMVDATGNVTVVGYTNSTNLPMVGASYQRTNQGKYDVFVMKLNALGSAILYSTYLGGANDDFAQGATLDATGNVIIGGHTFSTNFPTAGTPVLQAALKGQEDFYISRLNVPSGTQEGQLIFSTYLGGSGQDDMRAIQLDAAGNIYFTGLTTSPNYTATAGAAQSALAGQSDAVVVKLNPTATSILFLTYLGGSLFESPTSLAVEPDGSAVWVTGNTRSLNFPTTSTAMQKSYSGGSDGVISKLDSKGALLASTYIGGTGDDEADSIVLQNGHPVFIGVLTTDQYNKAASDVTAGIRAAATQPTMTFQAMNADLSDTTATTTYSSADQNLAYSGFANCQVSIADADTIVCSAASASSSQSTPTRGTVIAATMGAASSTPTTALPGITLQPNPRRSLQALHDPVDGAAGAFYDVISDLQLGGPLPLPFGRYYSSTLSSSGFLSSVGTNWMTSFDQRVDVVTNTARVLLFAGKVVSFTKAGAVWQLTAPLDISYQFVQSGSSYKLMDPSIALIYTFNSTGALTRIEDRNGDAITVTQGANGPVSASDGLGRTLTFTYAGGRLAKVQDQTLGRTVSFAYTGTVLNSSTDVLGQKTTYAYSSSGQLSSLMTERQYPLGARTAQVYDGAGRVTSQTIPSNKVTTISYDVQGGTKITDPFGAVTSQTFDSTGGATSQKDPLGSSFTVTYDAAGHRTGYADKNGNRVTMTYDAASGKIASEKSAAGINTSYSYTTQAQSGFTFYVLTGVTYGDGTTASIVYDAKGNATTVTDRLGGVTKYTYDALGRPASFVLPTNATTAYTYNADSTVATTTDPTGGVTTYGYDSMKRLVKITDPNARVTNYTYDPAGDVLTEQTPAGSTTTTTYDADGRRSTFTNATGGGFNFAYTPSGQVLSLANPAGGKRSYTYDGADRLGTVTDPAGVSTTYGYDAANQLTSVTNAAGLLYRYGYDKEGRQTSVTDGANRTWAFRYDADGRVAGRTSPGGGVYSLFYDAAGQLIKQVNPDNTNVSFTLDQAGRLAQTSIFGSVPASFTLTSSFKRNALGNTTEYIDPNGNKWGFTLDALERPLTLTDPLGNATTLTYDKQKLTGAALPLGTLAITTDANGKITKRQYSDGTVLNKSYDPIGLIASADGFTVSRDAAGRPTNTNGIAVTLDAGDRAKTFTYAAGKTVTYSYDAAGRVTGVTDWLGGTTSLSYDGAGQVIGITYPNGIRTTQAWDPNGRIERIITGSLASITLVRTPSGLVISAERSLPAAPKLTVASTISTYDAASQLVGAAYDKMGRATSQNGRTYTWNLASQLTGFTAGGQSSTMTYDGLAELSTLTTGGTTRSFVFNHLLHFPALSIVRQGGSDLRYYVYLPDGQLLYSVEAAGNARHFYHFDEMGNTTFLTGDNGQVTDTYAITPFGEVADRSGTTDNPFTWQGQFGVFQEGTGLYFLRSRHYDATVSRFLSRDALMEGDPRNAAPYVYAENNPLLNIDPDGNTPKEVTNAGLKLLNPSTTAAGRQDAYRTIAIYVEELYNTGRISGIDNFVIMATLTAGYEHANLDLVDFLNAAYPPDPPPPPPPPYVPPAKPALLSSTPVTLVSSGASAAPKLSCSKCTSNLLSSAGGLVNTNGSNIVAQGGGNIVAQGGGNIVAQGGGNLVNTNGSNIVAQGGGNIVAQGGGNIVAQGGGNIVAQGGGNIVAQGGGNLVNTNGSNIVAQGGGNLVNTNGSNIVAQGGGNIVAQGGGN
ncbi:MAG: RHS repeat-associated core domain-containing protein [Acidobacteriota bacterium]